MAAPTYVDSTKAGANSLSVNVSAPAGIAAGDLLVIIASTWSSRTLGTDPTGGAGTAWTTVADVTNTGGSFGVRSKVWRRVATAADIGATFTVTQAGGSAVGMSVLMTAYRGVRVGAPINAYATNGGSGLARVGPTLTTTIDDCAILLFDAAEWGTASAGNLSWSAGPTSRQYQVTDGGYNSLGYADEVKTTAGLTSARTSTHDAGSSPTKTAWQVAVAPAFFIPVGQVTETDEAQLVQVKGRIDVGQAWPPPETAQPITARRSYAIGQVTGTQLAQPIGRLKQLDIETFESLEAAKPITVSVPFNGGFASIDDITDENGYLPTYLLLSANTEDGEYTNGLTATLWWSWTCPDVAPYSIRWQFSYAGQSAAGGAAVRVYGPVDTSVIPGVGDVTVQDSATGATGEVEAVLASPTPGQTYLIQQGIVEKAGTVSHFLQQLTWVTPPTFTPVIP